MPLDPDRLFNLDLPVRRYSYDDSEPMLYALAVGATAKDLSFVYERDLKVIPSFAQIAAYDDSWLESGGIDLQHVVHGSLDIEFFDSFAASGTAEIRTGIAGLGDKGEGRGGIIHQSMEIAQNGRPVANCLSSLFVRGAGGFGGDRGRQPEAMAAPEGAPHAIVEVGTAANQAALFRLLGDRNPLHIDPEFARAAGFGTPILHGAATFGLACLTVLKAYCQGEPSRMKRFAARFSGPVFPGETLVFSFWQMDQEIRFRASAKERNAPVLDGGRTMIG